jgi:hypothetical protein
MSLRAVMLLAAIIVLAAGCSPGPSSGHAAPATRPVSCRRQYETWKHGPAQDPASKLKAALTAVHAARKTEGFPATKSAMTELVPAFYALAAHPIPRCADPVGLYAKFAIGIYEAGHHAQLAKRRSALRQAADQMKGLKKIWHMLAAEVTRITGATIDL